MNSPFLRRAGALLMALALACSLLTLPVSAADPSISGPTTLEAGKSATLDLNDCPMAQTITWTSDKPNVLSVQGSGISCQIHASANVSSDTMVTVSVEITDTTMMTQTVQRVITVTPPTAVNVPVDSISLSPLPVTLNVGETKELTASVSPANASDKTITWSSSNSNVTIVPGGNNNAQLSITGVRAGTTNITARAGSRTAMCQVTVNALPVSVSAVRLDKTNANISPDETLTLTATVEPTDAANRSLRWESSNPSLVRILPNTDGRSATVSVPSSTPVGTRATITVSSYERPSIQDLCFIQVVAPQAPEITAVAITSPSTDQFRYVDPGKTITLAATVTPYDAKDAEVTWSSANTSIARVRSETDLTGVVTGVAPGRVEITAKAGGPKVNPAVREIEVSGILLSYLRRSTTGGTGETISLNSNSVVDIYQYRDISVTPETFGNAKNRSITWESSNNSVAQVVSGRVTANYPGDAVIKATVDGTGFSASFKVHVSEDVADAITVNMGSNPSYSFSGILSQLNARSQSKGGAPLDCVYNLKVSTKNGVLYYRYSTSETPGHGVGGTERYYYQPSGQQMALRDVSFVPLPGFDGTAIVDYNAATTLGVTFTGTIRIEATATGDISYTTDAGRPAAFIGEHFSSVCQGRNGRALQYVTFSLPSSSQGILYYNYSSSGQYSQRVNSSTRYYATSSPSIDNISFVPAEGYTGNVSIPYRCVDSAGASFSGTVTIRVSGSGSSSGSGNVEYSINRNSQRTLNSSDFNSASTRVTGSSLEYIRFTSLPASSTGTLYLNYTSSSSARVAANTNYYRSSSPRISGITFVPASNYTGTVTIPFTGTNSSQATFSGNLIIHVGTGGGTVHYNTYRNQPVTLSAWDFNDASRWATGQTLDYIRFTSLPSSSAGTLYYNYNGANAAGTRVAVNTDYRRSGSPALSSVTFVPASGYTGTVTIPFTGYDDNGARFDGTLTITVEGSGSTTTTTNIRYTGSSSPISLRASDFQSVCQGALGNPLSYVLFNSLPASGRLYQNYTTPSKPGAVVSSGVRYTAQDLGQITYVPKAEYQGTLSVPYTVYDSQGGSYSGLMEFQLSNSYCYASFSDTASGWDWAMPSIEYLRASGITSGYRDNTYRPAQSISRGEFTLMVCRAFQFPTTGSSTFPDVPANSTYAGAISSARDLGIVQGNNGRFQPDRPITRQSAMTMICRAIQAAGQSLPTADSSLLNTYTDGSQVSAFARPSVAALVQMGAVRGNSAMRLNPGAPISRAEMAVILHRVLTR